jgi:hypothetical protein
MRKGGSSTLQKEHEPGQGWEDTRVQCYVMKEMNANNDTGNDAAG